MSRLRILLCRGLLDKVIFQQPGIPRVGLVKGVGDVSEERYEPDRKIGRDVEIHSVLESTRKPALDLVGLADNPVSQ